MIEWKDTGRGFRVGRFKDRYGINCSIQESSLATEHCIWLGCDETSTGEGARMHLTQEQVADLLPALIKFVHTGVLSSDPATE